jgi:hypothetical protein
LLWVDLLSPPPPQLPPPAFAFAPLVCRETELAADGGWRQSLSEKLAIYRRSHMHAAT